jgi:hypothetical protein
MEGETERSDFWGGELESRSCFGFLMNIARERRSENSRWKEACTLDHIFVNVGVRSSVSRELG